MSRTTRNTYMTNWSAHRRDRYADPNSWWGHSKPIERNATFNGRDGHHIGRGLKGASTRSPKGCDAWDDKNPRGANRRAVKRDTAKIIRRRGKDEIAKAKKDNPKGDHLFY